MNKRTYSQILDDVARDQTPADLNLAPPIMMRIQKGKSQIMQSRMKAFAAVMVILLVLAALFFTVPEVTAAIRHWFGYIPGVGLVREGQIRMLAEPVSLTREGITVTVEQVILESDSVTIRYRTDGIPRSAYVHDFNNDWCTRPMIPNLRFPGWELDLKDMNTTMGDDGGMLYKFSTTPPATNDAVFVLPCLYNVRAGAVPEDWEIPLHFIPAPPDMTAFPVIEIPTPTAPAATNTTQQPPASESENITLTLDRAVQMDDGYLIYASLHWQGEGLHSIDMVEPENTLHLLDAGGQEMLYEIIYDDTTGMQVEQHQTIFALKTAPVQVVGPLTIVVDSASADIPAQADFTFDPGTNPQPGQTWQLDQDVKVGDYSLRVLTAMAGETGYSFEMVSESGILSAALVDAEHQIIGGGGGGGGLSGVFSAGFTYADRLPDGPVTVTISSLSVRRDGPWQAQWTPPGVSTTDFPNHPPACLNASSWRQALAQNLSLPEGLDGTLLLRNLITDGSGTWKYAIVRLDGTGEQPLPDIRDGALSPDGNRLAYSADAIAILDLASGQKIPVPGTSDVDFNPVWSPDGSQIVFMRGGTYELYIVNLDGSGLRPLTNGGLQEWPIGWLPDGRHLVYIMPDSRSEYDTYLLDVQSGESQPFSDGNIESISPDGSRAISTEDVFGDRLLVYASDLDGSNRQLVADSDIWAMAPLWNPDGQWLLFNISATDPGSTVPALLRLEDCAIIPLPHLNGEVTSWAP